MKQNKIRELKEQNELLLEALVNLILAIENAAEGKNMEEAHEHFLNALHVVNGICYDNFKEFH